MEKLTFYFLNVTFLVSLEIINKHRLRFEEATKTAINLHFFAVAIVFAISRCSSSLITHLKQVTFEIVVLNCQLLKLTS